MLFFFFVKNEDFDTFSISFIKIYFEHTFFPVFLSLNCFAACFQSVRPDAFAIVFTWYNYRADRMARSSIPHTAHIVVVVVFDVAVDIFESN